jgi:hypothetical protein
LTRSKGICYSEDVLIFFKVFAKVALLPSEAFFIGCILCVKNA